MSETEDSDNFVGHWYLCNQPSVLGQLVFNTTSSARFPGDIIISIEANTPIEEET